MIQVQTGNAVNVCYDYEDGHQVIKGLMHDGVLIPLRDPKALADVILKVVKECEGTR